MPCRGLHGQILLVSPCVGCLHLRVRVILSLNMYACHAQAGPPCCEHGSACDLKETSPAAVDAASPPARLASFRSTLLLLPGTKPLRGAGRLCATGSRQAALAASYIAGRHMPVPGVYTLRSCMSRVQRLERENGPMQIGVVDLQGACLVAIDLIIEYQQHFSTSVKRIVSHPRPWIYVPSAFACVKQAQPLRA